MKDQWSLTKELYSCISCSFYVERYDSLRLIPVAKKDQVLPMQSDLLRAKYYFHFHFLQENRDGIEDFNKILNSHFNMA